jgi:signal transduction histidine kinase
MEQALATTKATQAPQEAHFATINTGLLRVIQGLWVTVFGSLLLVAVIRIPQRIANLFIVDYTSEIAVRFGIDPQLTVWFQLVSELLTVAVFVGAAIVIVWRKSDDATAILISLMLLTYGPLETTFISLATLEAHVARPIGAALRSVGEILSLTVLCILPDGRYIPRWTRWLSGGYAIIVALWFCFPDLPLNAIYGVSFYRTPILSLLFVLSIHLVSVFALVQRVRTGLDPIQRQQVRWVFVGLIAAFITSTMRYGFYVFTRPLPDPTADYYVLDIFLIRPLAYAGLAIAPICITFAVIKHRLWDLKPIVNRTLVYGALTASIIGIYIGIVVFLGRWFHVEHSLALSLLATGIVAVAVLPLRTWLQGSVNRMLYGMRDDPAAVLHRFGTHLEATLTPQAALEAIVRTVHETLKLPYVAITATPALRRHEWPMRYGDHRSTTGSRSDDAGDSPSDGPTHEVLACIGTAPGMVITVPLTYQGEQIGRLLVAPRSADEPLTPPEQQVLEILSPQIATAVQTLRLTLDLQRARERLVTAREEERRRLRRDLHDGIGPMLASQTYLIDTIRLLTEQHPDQARTLLAELGSQTQGATTTIRQLVEGLRPPALDDLGLSEALQEHTTRYATAQLQVEFTAPQTLPPLPAAVEVAAYRIVQEAMTNVVKHARARHCLVALQISDTALDIEVYDDGCGLPARYQAGVGLHSMRERARELGGRCHIAPRPGGGTTVSVHLPR